MSAVDLSAVERTAAALPAPEAVDYLLEVVRGLVPDEVRLARWRDVVPGLRPRECQLLEALYARRGQFVCRRALLAALLATTPDGGSDRNLLATYVCHIRRKLPEGLTIETSYGLGYRLLCPPLFEGRE